MSGYIHRKKRSYTQPYRPTAYDWGKMKRTDLNWRVLENYNYLGVPMGDSGLWIAAQYKLYGIKFRDYNEGYRAYMIQCDEYGGANVIFGEAMKYKFVRWDLLR